MSKWLKIWWPLILTLLLGFGAIAVMWLTFFDVIRSLGLSLALSISMMMGAFLVVAFKGNW